MSAARTASIISRFVAAALKYRWVFLKDDDTAKTDTSGLTAEDIPFASEQENGAIEPLTVQTFPVHFKVRRCLRHTFLRHPIIGSGSNEWQMPQRTRTPLRAYKALP